jgi:hypothetical protein
LPIGTSKGKQAQVCVRTKYSWLIISTTEDNQEICSHTIAAVKDKKYSKLTITGIKALLFMR